MAIDIIQIIGRSNGVKFDRWFNIANSNPYPLKDPD